MAETLFSASWYRVKDLVPRLRSHARIHRHRYRGEIWYVLQDPASDRFHRFTPGAHSVIAMMDGHRTVDEIWRLASEILGDDAPVQDELIQLLGQLHAADVLQCDTTPDAEEIFERARRQTQQRWKSRWMSPLFFRIGLVDPERFLSATLPAVRWIFSALGAAIWGAVVIPALVLAGVHWSALTSNILDRLFTPANIALVWVLFPVLKGLHELGHGYAAKVFGGQVHDMGIMFLVFTPVPYVDASSSWAFRSKYRRALVGAGGMVVEVFVAAIAFYVWLLAEPGASRAIAHNVLLIGGATTLLFNANPLLRFDGYYILSDLTEIPNLRTRANAYLGWLTERYAFGSDEAERPHTAPGEPGWLVSFAIASFVYRVLIIAAILTWILDQFFVVGVLLGAFASVGWLGVPLYKGLKHLFTSPTLRSVRGRAVAVSAAALALVAIGVSVVPVPMRTRAEGVVWIPEEAFVRARSEGFISRLDVEPGAHVEPGELLIEIRDPVLETEKRRLEARVRELEARADAERTRDRVALQVTQEELHLARKQLARARERVEDLDIRSATAGSFVVPRSEDLPGRFVYKGELLAHVVDLKTISVRAVVSQDDVDLVRRRTAGVEVRLAERIEEPRSAEMKRIVPAASERLPSRALGSVGGGEVPVDPSDRQGNRAVQSMFEVELELPATSEVVNAGGRVYVRFDHGTEPLALQWYRRLRQLFLSRFHV